MKTMLLLHENHWFAAQKPLFSSCQRRLDALSWACADGTKNRPLQQEIAHFIGTITTSACSNQYAQHGGSDGFS